MKEKREELEKEKEWRMLGASHPTMQSTMEWEAKKMQGWYNIQKSVNVIPQTKKKNRKKKYIISSLDAEKAIEKSNTPLW